MAKKLKNYTVAELKLMAKEQGIDLPEGALKANIVEALEEKGNNVITANTTKPHGKPSVGVTPVNNGVIGSAVADKLKKKPRSNTSPVVSNGKIALYSDKNLSWVGVGKLSKGYNFVSKESSERWLKHKAVREATPEEVARHYGVD